MEVTIYDLECIDLLFIPFLKLLVLEFYMYKLNIDLHVHKLQTKMIKLRSYKFR